MKYNHLLGNYSHKKGHPLMLITNTYRFDSQKDPFEIRQIIPVFNRLINHNQINSSRDPFLNLELIKDNLLAMNLIAILSLRQFLNLHSHFLQFLVLPFSTYSSDFTDQPQFLYIYNLKLRS